MRVIWKYPLPLSVGEFHVHDIPDGIVRHLGEQSRTIMMWVEVDPDAPLTTRTFQIVGTGNPEIGAGFVYLGTVPIGPFVWHVYETTPKRTPEQEGLRLMARALAEQAT